ncbi:MAG: formate dehydrogenase accessory protein FdhE [Desulfobulbaceae bacterium]|nr:formate dehydrogenase accessory protein FdhE [Desulfobulbaceae bacterium]
MKKKTSEELNRIIKRIHAIGIDRPSHKEVLDFYKYIIREQHKIKPAIRVKPMAMTAETAKTHLREGFHLLDKNAVLADLEPAVTLFKNICRSLMRNYRKAAPEIKKINKAVRQGEIDLEQLFGKMVEGDREYIDAIAAGRDFNAGLLRVLAESSIHPLLEAYAGKLKGLVDQDAWWKTSCPVCGSTPVLGELKNSKDIQGAKFFLCSSCGFEWRYHRLGCPFCGNGKQEKLRHFTTEADGKGYRVEVCEECRKYIKTMDLRETGAVMPLVDDIGTLHLDIIAMKEGYTRGTPGILEMEQFGE